MFGENPIARPTEFLLTEVSTKAKYSEFGSK